MISVPSDNGEKEGFLLSIWQAITLVGDVRERSDELDSSELETVLAEAESLLIGAVSEVAHRPGGPNGSCAQCSVAGRDGVDQHRPNDRRPGP